MKLLPLYEAIFDKDAVQGVFGISLVESPATRELFIQLSEDKQKEILKETEIKLSTISEEQRLLVGLVLEPDAPVYRNQDGEEFNIVFKEDTIKQLAHNFFIGDHHKTSTIEHSGKEIKGITFVESWIVADSKRDKSNVYGLEYPSGSWLVAMKVDSEQVWSDYVKTGKVKGFSIDAVVKLKKVENNNKKDVKMSKTILERLADGANKVSLFLNEKAKKVEVKFGQIMMEGGEIIFEYEGDMLEAGVNVFAVDKSDETVKIPVPTGKYPLEDGSIMVVEEEGVVSEIMPAEVEEAPAEPTPAPAPEPVAANNDQSVVNDIKSILIKYEEKFDAKMAEIEQKIEGMSGEVVKMSEKPKVKPKTTQATVQLNKTGRLLETLRNANN
jgi:hypothetical protein